jgi:uncharacterized protein YndB with AHSA1/START domain
MPLNLWTRAPNVTAITLSAQVTAPADRVFQAFFDSALLQAWWQVTRSVTVPRVLGPYVLEWDICDTQDDVMGRIGGVLRGTVMQIEPDRAFFIADLFWLPISGDPIGPMALDVTCAPVADKTGSYTEIRVAQTGFEDSVRWRQYYELAKADLTRAMAALKALVESGTTETSG